MRSAFLRALEIIHLCYTSKSIWACRRVGGGGKRPAGLWGSLGPGRVQNKGRTAASIWELKENPGIQGDGISCSMQEIPNPSNAVFANCCFS